MSEIRIDLKKVRKANYNLPAVVSNLSSQKRYVNMIRWRVPSEIQERREIQKRLDEILKRIEKEEERIQEIYKVTGSAVQQYVNLETTLTENASKFE